MDASNKFSDFITPISTSVLDAPPSCLEFVPRDHNPRYEYFVVGTYTLLAVEDQTIQDDEQEEYQSQEAEPQNKVGSLKLFKIDHDQVRLIQEMVYQSAIFDLHFLPDSPYFAVVSNMGDISVFKISQDNELGVCSFENVATHHLVDAQITYFAWYPYGQGNPPLLAATLHTGKLLIARFSDWDFSKIELLDDEEETLKITHGHDESAWCCVWSSPTSAISEPGISGKTLFSGGDDGKLRLLNMSSAPILPDSSFSINTELDALDTGRRIFSPHTSGITFILPLPISTSDTACILLTGGYDDFVRVYTTYDFRVGTRTYTRPKVLAELNLGGGVWRLKFLHDYEKLRRGGPTHNPQPTTFKVLASCAWAGARILDVRGSLSGEWSIEVVGTVTIHQSMCYASDVQPIENEDYTQPEARVCVSTSFYDKLMCVWKWDPTRAVVEAASSPL